MTLTDVIGILIGAAVVYFGLRYAYRTLKAKRDAPRVGSTGSGGGGKDRNPDKR